MTRKLLTATMGAVTATAILLAPIFFAGGVRADAAEIKILCANGMRAVVTELHPQLERTTGRQVTMSFGEAGDLKRRLEGGELADVIVLPKVVMEQVMAQNRIVPGTSVDLAQSGMGIGVRSDAPKPDISSVDGFKRALLAAKSIVITDPASGGVSGVHIADVFQRLGIAEQVKPKLKLNRGGPNAAFVARGEAEMAIQLAHEIRTVPGIEFIPLPVEFQRAFVFSAGLASNAKDSDAAKALIQFLASPTAVTVIRAKGLDPVPSR